MNIKTDQHIFRRKEERTPLKEEQDRQCMSKVIVKRLHLTVVAAETQ